jgi:hypothetical protein
VGAKTLFYFWIKYTQAYKNINYLHLQAFTVIAVLNSMRFSLGVLPFAVKALADAKVSFKRYKVCCSKSLCHIPVLNFATP